jgi:hypothetical protein
MAVFKRGGKTVLFVHCPKTGGSSVEAAAERSGWKEFYSLRGVNLLKEDALRLSPQHMHVELLNYFFNLEQFSSIFMLVRDPLTRIKSEYYWQKRKSGGLERPGIWLERVFDEYSSDNYVYDNHIRPQIEFDVNTSNSRWYKLEDDGINRAINDVFGRKKFSFIRRGEKKKVSLIDESVEFEFRRLSESVWSFYRRDYEFFGYPKS